MDPNDKMPRELGHVTALLSGTAFLVLGNGLQGTLIAVRAGLEGMTEQTIGLIMSAYFLGFIVGSVYTPRLIAAVGHIRTFAALASIASAVALTFAIFVSSGAWLVLRLIHGTCYAGLIIIVESWLNAVTPRRNRGRVLAIYNIVLFAALVASQPLLIVSPPSGFVLFLIVSICLSLALVPVTLSRADVPGVVTATRSSLPRLIQISPIGTVGAFVTGVWGSAYWGMGPVFAQSIGLSNAGIAAFMSIPMMGTLALQWPLGWLSDVIDRRLVIIGSCVVAATAALGLAWMGGSDLTVLLALGFVYGGFAITMYSVCIAHVNDFIEGDEFVAVASSLILAYGAGSVLGPIGASLLMTRLGPEGLFLFSAAVQILFAVFGVFRLGVRAAANSAAKDSFVTVPKTTHTALPLHRHSSERVEGETAAPG